MRALAVIQARMGSKRLPGKMLMQLGERTLLEQVIERARAVRTISDIVVATTTLPEDDAIVAAATALHVVPYRGDSENVYERVMNAIDFMGGAEVVVRICGDAYLFAPGFVDHGVDALLRTGRDLYCTREPYHVFQGADVISYQALETSGLHADDELVCEHVTAWAFAHQELFDCVRFRPLPWQVGGEKLSIDTAEDLELARSVYDAIPERPVPLHAAVQFIRAGRRAAESRPATIDGRSRFRPGRRR